MNKLSYEEKVNQYLNAVIRLNRNINARDAGFFTIILQCMIGF